MSGGVLSYFVLKIKFKLRFAKKPNLYFRIYASQIDNQSNNMMKYYWNIQLSKISTLILKGTPTLPAKYI